MVIKEVKQYLKETGSASLSELILEIDASVEMIDAALNHLIAGGRVEVSLSTDVSQPGGGCSGCSGGCSPKEIVSCKPESTGFKIYTWKENS